MWLHHCKNKVSIHSWITAYKKSSLCRYMDKTICLPIFCWINNAIEMDALWIRAAHIEINDSIVQPCIKKTQPTHSRQKIMCEQVELEPQSGERIRRCSIGKAQSKLRTRVKIFLGSHRARLGQKGFREWRKKIFVSLCAALSHRTSGMLF